MALSSTVKKMNKLLEEVSSDLTKAVGGNKAAAQRVRVNTVALEKVAKLYRKESVSSEKKGPVKKKKKPAAKKKAVAKKKPAAKKKTVAKKKAVAKKKPVAKKKSIAKKSTAAKKKKR